VSERRAALIVIEGIDGSGTTTQSRRLVDALRARGRDARHTFEPTPGPIGTLIRAALEKRLTDPLTDQPRVLASETLALLFAADRLDHLDSFVLPALAEGAIVVSDRYDLSSLVYQSATAPSPGQALPWLRVLNRAARRPELTLVLDVPFEEAKARRKQRGGAEELFDADALQRRLAAAYAGANDLVPGDPLVHLSGVGSPDQVTARLLAAVLQVIGD
jgi:dTMP kinase